MWYKSNLIFFSCLICLLKLLRPTECTFSTSKQCTVQFGLICIQMALFCISSKATSNVKNLLRLYQCFCIIQMLYFWICVILRISLNLSDGSMNSKAKEYMPIWVFNFKSYSKKASKYLVKSWLFFWKFTSSVLHITNEV